MRSSEDESEGPVIHDRRRIDPVTGQVRDTARQAAQGQGGSSQRGPGQHRPGKHAVSKPGGAPAGPAAGPSSESAAAAGSDPAGPAPDAPGAQTPGSQEGAPAAGAGPSADPELAIRLAERTADLQRLQAEYANYRKRVERDRLAVREQALANVLTELLPMLDDIGRAREHGELVGGFKSVADSMESAVVKLGLARYGEAGDPFDPTLHEALMHSYSAEVTEPTCVRILQPGYKVGDRILRPALVAVAEPEGPADATSEHDETGNSGEEGYPRGPQYGAADTSGGEADADGDGRGSGGAN